MNMNNKKYKKYVFNNAFLVVLSLVFSFFVGEIILRFFEFAPIAINWHYAENDRANNWNHVEVSDVGTSVLNGMTLEGESNSLGLRDAEYPLQTEKFRILAVGDSFTYGFKLTNASSWPKLTEKYLHEAGWDDIEILNGGRPGADTQFQYDLFRKYTSRYKPDMVIIGFLINDCAADVCSNCGAVDLKRELDNIIEQKKKWYSSRLLTTIRTAYYKHILTKTTINEYFTPYRTESKELQECKEAFLDFKKMSEAMNFKLIVVIYPKLYKLDEKHPFHPIHDTMLRFFSSYDIEAYDLTPSFYGRKDIDLWVEGSDSHPNRKANKIAARRIGEIIENYLHARTNLRE